MIDLLSLLVHVNASARPRLQLLDGGFMYALCPRHAAAHMQNRYLTAMGGVTIVERFLTLEYLHAVLDAYETYGGPRLTALDEGPCDTCVAEAREAMRHDRRRMGLIRSQQHPLQKDWRSRKPSHR